jgi:hypothetical protein
MRDATVVSRASDGAAVSPVCSSRNEPVPYVFLASPGRKQAWPKSAACWSPAMPAIGTAAPNNDGSVSPTTPLESTTSDSTLDWTESASSMSLSQSPVWML